MNSRKPAGLNMPLRTAPPRPTVPSKYSPVVGWNDEPFSNDPFEPYSCIEKKKPPPRPPPPKINKSQNEPRSTHFNRRPTILSTLLSRKSKPNGQTDKEDNIYDFTPSIDMLSAQSQQNNGYTSSSTTGVLIDFASPPSSPTFTTRSSSDGLSIDSFGSDATSSTQNHNFHGGNISQAESGFEDDFDLFSSRKPGTGNGDQSDPWGNSDPFSPTKLSQKPALPKKPVLFLDKSDFVDPLCNGKTVLPKVATHKIPTIIRSKPARPRPPDNSSLLNSSLKSLLPLSSTTHTRFARQENVATFPTSFEVDFPSSESSPEREPSPPMPTVPPPPPPVLDDEDGDEELSTPLWPQLEAVAFNSISSIDPDNEEPYAIATYDFSSPHSDDLPFTIGAKVRLLRKVNEEWMYGKLRNGTEGMFPVSYVDIKIALKESAAVEKISRAKVMYDFSSQQPGDLSLSAGSIVKVTGKVNDEWLLGECNGSRGQFPASYVEYLP